MLENEFPWVVMRLGTRIFALSSKYVMEMLVLPSLSRMPQAKEYVRGVMNLRNNVIMVMDLRKRLHMPSAFEEVEALVALLSQREQDHKNWLAELDASVREKRDFKLTTDPHQCAFGKWYDTYKATNLILENHLKKFDAPHKRIHAIAEEVEHLKNDGKIDEAVELIERTRNASLSHMVKLFEDARKILRETLQEIAIVLEHGEQRLALTVDSIESVEYLKENTIEDLTAIEGRGGIVTKTGRLEKNEKIVMLINVESLFNDMANAGVDLNLFDPTASEHA